jgi:hypothetical protein
MDETGIWGGAILAGVLLAVFAVLAVRSRRRVGNPDKAGGPGALLSGLIGEAISLDLVPESGGEPLARCVPLELGPRGLTCELLDCAAPEAVHAGRSVMGFFAPITFEGRKVNAFDTEILSVESVLEPPRILLSAPTQFRSIPRRRHSRKRVSDPRFVRLRLWRADIASSTLYFPEASPDIWINAYDGRHGEENAVSDISAGGVALEIRAALVPTGLAPGAAVVLKCSLFQFRDKQFNPYWYAGVVRAITTPTENVRRIAVAFSHVGAPHQLAPQGLVWTALELVPPLPETTGAES